MQLKFPLLILILGLLAVPMLAQDHTGNTVQFNGFGFQFDSALGSSVNIGQIPGDPVESAGPGFSDAAKVQFTLYHFGQLTDSLFDTGGVRVYRMTDLAQYDFLMTQVEQLETLLIERPDLSQFEPAINEPAIGGLPYVPVLTHGQTLTARAQYIETDAVKGIGYVAVYRADLGPFTPQDFLYTFQGISQDGHYYVTVTIPLKTALFPEMSEDYDPETFYEQWPEYLVESIATLNTAPLDAFTPSLDLVDALVQSIQLNTR